MFAKTQDFKSDTAKPIQLPDLCIRKWFQICHPKPTTVISERQIVLLQVRFSLPLSKLREILYELAM